MSQNNEIKNIMSLIQNLDVSTGFDVYIPSLQKDIKFKQLTTEQLKQILKTVIDSPVYNTEFTLTFNQIIKENCLDTTVSIDNLTIYDKLLIFFKTRLESVSSDYTLSFTNDEIKDFDLTEKTKTISIKDHYNNFLNKKIIFEKEQFDYNNCIVVCDLPTLSTENKLEKELHKNIKVDINTPEELRNIIGETFINEITKYISSISVNETIIDFNTQTFKNRINIVESLPTNLINKVIKYIERYRNTVKELLSINVSAQSATQNTVQITKDIPLDATFFNM
jgi:hypothetical protein